MFLEFFATTNPVRMSDLDIRTTMCCYCNCQRLIFFYEDQIVANIAIERILEAYSEKFTLET